MIVALSYSLRNFEEWEKFKRMEKGIYDLNFKKIDLIPFPAGTDIFQWGPFVQGDSSSHPINVRLGRVSGRVRLWPVECEEGH